MKPWQIVTKILEVLILKKILAHIIFARGRCKSLEDLANMVMNEGHDRPILVKDVAVAKYGKAPRYGAMTRNGEEVVGGRVMMFKGANSAQVTELVKERVIQIQKSLPDDIIIEPYLVRDKLV